MKMPTTECSGSSSPFAHSILGIRRDHQVHSMDSSLDAGSNIQSEADLFQKRVSDRIHDLSSASSDDLLSLAWIRKLVDAFLCFHEEFRAIIQVNRARFAKPPMDRLVGDFFDRCVKALDVCNAVRDGVEQISQWQKLIEIVVCALSGQRSIGEGQFRRARKALVDLTIGMLDDKDSGTAISQRNRSFCRNRDQTQRSIAQFRSLSWSVSRSWSAAKQLQAIAANLTPPKANEIVATNGFAVSIFTMNCVLLFTMWSLVAAIPCQDRGLQIHFPIPRQFSWSAPMLSLHDRIMEESKKRDRRNSCGLLKEINLIEKCSKNLIEIGDSIQFPLHDEKEMEVRKAVDEVSHVCEAIREGLDPFERQVREVFHRIVRSRTEGLDSLGSKTGTD